MMLCVSSDVCGMNRGGAECVWFNGYAYTLNPSAFVYELACVYLYYIYIYMSNKPFLLFYHLIFVC